MILNHVRKSIMVTIFFSFPLLSLEADLPYLLWREEPESKPLKPEVIIERKVVSKPDSEKTPFDCCYNGSVPPVLYTLLNRIKNPALYRLPNSGIQNPPNFYMLYGGSRTGKTFMIETFIKEVGTSSVSRTGGELSLGTHDTISKISVMFTEAREKAERYGSCIIELDECEPAFISRNAMTPNNQAFHGASTLWKLIDEHRESHPNILILAATNLFESLDEAVRKRVSATAIQLPYDESHYQFTNSTIRTVFNRLFHNKDNSHGTQEKFLKILSQYRRTEIDQKDWELILNALHQLDDGIIANIAESAVRFALDDYYEKIKPEKLKTTETKYYTLKKKRAENHDSSTIKQTIKKLEETQSSLTILTQALHRDALENVIVRQKHIELALAIVLNNRAHSQPSLLKITNEKAREYAPLITTAVAIIGLGLTLKNAFSGDVPRNNTRLPDTQLSSKAVELTEKILLQK